VVRLIDRIQRAATMNDANRSLWSSMGGKMPTEGSEVVGHYVDAVVLCFFSCLKDSAVQRLANTEHEAFAGTYDGAITNDVLLWPSVALSFRPQIIIHLTESTRP